MYGSEHYLVGIGIFALYAVGIKVEELDPKPGCTTNLSNLPGELGDPFLGK